MNPCIKQDPEKPVAHCGTNDLETEKDHVKIADNILGLAHQCKTNNHHVMISEVVPQNDNLNSYAIIVIKILRKVCGKRNNGFIDKDVKYNLITSPLLNKYKKG